MEEVKRQVEEIKVKLIKEQEEAEQRLLDCKRDRETNLLLEQMIKEIKETKLSV